MEGLIKVKQFHEGKRQVRFLIKYKWRQELTFTLFKIYINYHPLTLKYLNKTCYQEMIKM